ncbi:aminopeptidase P family protein [Candidatus Nomurabacteria bacterium]|nr:aminopeptidase P family protein [Candidatus Nomurabacteria bacterium]
MKSANLYIGRSRQDSNLYYLSGFDSPDPFGLLIHDDKKVLFISPLEYDIAKATSKADLVVDFYKGAQSGLIGSIIGYLKEYKIGKLWLDGSIDLQYYMHLRQEFPDLILDKIYDSFLDQREVKSDQDIAYIRQAQVAVDLVYAQAIDFLSQAKIRGQYLYRGDQIVTSEMVKQLLRVELARLGYDNPEGMILSSGLDTADPHCQGSGPILANQFIVFDIFPRSIESLYYTDMSRTVIRGQATDGQLALYDAVYQAQTKAIKKVKQRASYYEIDQAIRKKFVKQGFETKLGQDGHQQGYFHGLGHGVGLDIHEQPNPTPGEVLWQNQVITIEPGLYYTDPKANTLGVVGGVRIEDTLVVTEQGSINLAKSPKDLVI